MSARGLRLRRVTVKPVRSELAGVAARVESLPLAVPSHSLRTRLGDFVRWRMGESTRQVEGLFESLLAQSFDGGRSPKGML
jgi:hypothetical protein